MGTMDAIGGACNMCHQMPMITITIELGSLMPPCPDKEPTSIIDRDWSLEPETKKPSDVFKSMKDRKSKADTDGDKKPVDFDKKEDEDDEEDDEEWHTKD